MAIPIHVETGAKVGSTGALTVAIPTSRQLNDILLLYVESANEVVATPSGWGIVANSPQGIGSAASADATRLSVFWKRSDGTETTIEVADSGDHQVAYVSVFRGCILTGDPWDVTAGDTLGVGSESTAVTIPGATTTVADCLIVAVSTHSVDLDGSQFSGWANADLSGVVEIADTGTNSSHGGGIGVALGGKAAIGAFGPTTATLANASIQARLSIALKPEPPPAFNERRALISFVEFLIPAAV